MKNIRRFTFIVVASFIGFFSAISLSQIQIKPIKFEDEKIVEAGDVLRSQNDFLDDVIGRVKKGYVDEKTDRDLAEAAATGILSSLDPHSSYMTAEDLKEIHVQTSGKFGGVGIEITMEMMVVKVISPIEGTPAFKAGMKSGDYIIKIEGKTVVGMTITDVVKKLRGKPGSDVNITVLRKGEKAPLEIELTREIIKVKAVRSARFNNVAYVKINSFSEQAYTGLKKELKKLKSKIGKKNLQGLVLDLRNNPGGLLNQAVKVSDAFLNKGQNIVSIKGRSSKARNYNDESDEKLVPNLPIVVLINEGSASASEIVSGALQDHGRAIIMGVKSFGKGSVQTVIPLDEGRGALRMTTSLYYTPSGKSIQAHGIEPDIEVTSAKIEKDKPTDRGSESELKGHIEVKLQQFIKESEAEKNKLTEENFDLYEKDYQLARALDLVRGVSLYKSKTKK